MTSPSESLLGRRFLRVQFTRRVPTIHLVEREAFDGEKRITTVCGETALAHVDGSTERVCAACERKAEGVMSYPSEAKERLERDREAFLAECVCPPGDIHLPSCAVQRLYVPRGNGRLKPEYIDPEIPAGAELHIYWCPKCERQTERAWHIASRPNPLIPQLDDEHSCIRVRVVPKP